MMTALRRTTVLFTGFGVLAVLIFVGCRTNFGDVLIGGGGSDFLLSGRTQSFFRAIQVDPRREDSAGPQFVVAEDLNANGLVDLVSAWNESQPLQIHLQRRTAGVISFETVTIAGNVPIVNVAGLAVADFDGDGAMDIAVLLKNSLTGGGSCLSGTPAPQDAQGGMILLYLGPTNPQQTNQALAWREVVVEASRLAGTAGGPWPEDGGFSAMTVGDINRNGRLDFAVAVNSACDGEGSGVLVFNNQGRAAVRDGTWTVTRIPDTGPAGTIKGLALGDVDGDGDLDVVATFPDAPSMNVRWFRNPAIDLDGNGGGWQTGTVGHVATGADIVRLGDIDGDGNLDVVMRSTNGTLIQWFKGPGDQALTAPLRNIPWQVYTIADFSTRVPHAIALGDFTGNGRLELIASGDGALALIEPVPGRSVYEQWASQMIVDDSNHPTPTDPSVTPASIVAPTFINDILVVDLDGDGRNDFIATLDRTGLSGLSNDALVWFRNVRP